MVWQSTPNLPMVANEDVIGLINSVTDLLSLCNLHLSNHADKNVVRTDAHSVTNLQAVLKLWMVSKIGVTRGTMFEV